MTESLLMLRLEHRNTAALLNCLDHQLELLKSGEPVNNRVIALALGYFEEFPDRCHHPKEDLIYEALRHRKPELAEGLGDLVHDHEKLSETTRRLGDSFREPGTSAPLEHILDEFLSSYRRHMQAEEEHFFPAAEEALTDGDWASIDFSVFDSDDPLFHHSEESEFAELREIIAELDEIETERIHYHHEAEKLKELNSAKDFNLAMKKEGHSIRLVRFADKSWGLEDRGRLLFRIPPCSELQAAWGAALFHRGMIAEHGQPLVASS